MNEFASSRQKMTAFLSNHGKLHFLRIWVEKYCTLLLNVENYFRISGKSRERSRNVAFFDRILSTFSTPSPVEKQLSAIPKKP